MNRHNNDIRKSYGKTAKRGAAWSIVRQGGHELIAIPMSMVMARLLTPREFGVAVAASFFVLLAARLTQFGFAAAIVRVKELKPDHLSSSFVVGVAMGVLCYVSLFLASPAIGRFFDSEAAGQLVRVSALTFLIGPLSSVSVATMTRNMRFKYLAVADWTDTLVGAVVTIALAARGWSYWSIAVGNVVATASRVALQLYLAQWRPSLRVSKAALRELLSFGLGVQTKRLLEYASANLDTMVVGKLLDMTSLGFYDKSFSTMNRLVTRLTFGQAPFRIFSIIQDDRERFRRAYARLILSITMIGYPALTVCIVVADDLFDVLYGAQWQRAVLPFQILCVGGMVKLLNNYGSQANEAAGAIWLQARRQAIGTALIVAGAGAGAWLGGIVGAAAGVTIATILLTVAMQALVMQALGLGWVGLLRPQVPAFGCGLLVAGAVIATRLAADQWAPWLASWQRLPLLLAAGGLVYAAFVLFGPSRALREVVDESADEMLPARLAHRVHSLRWPRGAQSA